MKKLITVLKNLTLMWHSTGLAPDYLAGAMILNESYLSIKRVELAYGEQDVYDLSPIFRCLVEKGKLQIENWSNFNMATRFKAGAMGLFFLPSQSPLYGNISESNRTKKNLPFTRSPISLIPACYLDVSIIHVQAAGKYGNCIIRGSEFPCPEIAVAFSRTTITCEKLIEYEVLIKHPKYIQIPFLEEDAVLNPLHGCPIACRRHYYYNESHIQKFSFSQQVHVSKYLIISDIKL